MRVATTLTKGRTIRNQNPFSLITYHLWLVWYLQDMIMQS